MFPACLLAAGAASCGTHAAGDSDGDSSSADASPEIPEWNGDVSLVFVSRGIPENGTPYLQGAKGLLGIGSHSRFRTAGPGRLLVREADGAIRTLIDGANPSATPLNLLDVNAPEVSYDGTRIVFAGIPVGSYSGDEREHPGAWRIYVINVDGTDLSQVTFSDRDSLDLSQFGNQTYGIERYDDTDPVWLPDGRIAFSSTRWPAIAQYVDVPATNLYVVSADGSDLHRITAERNGADRPLVDPITGKLVFFRWWRNMRNATDSMETIESPSFPDGYAAKDGLVAENMFDTYGGVPGLHRNAWQIVSINPDGTGLVQWGGVSGVASDQFLNHAYGGSIGDDGVLYANYPPLHHLADQSGFGGIRRYERGPHGYTPVIGVADDNGPLVREDPPSYNVFQGPYAAEPEALPDGRVIVSWAADTEQDYGLYIMDGDGQNLEKVYDEPGTAELRARLIRPRALPPIIADTAEGVASLLPPTAEGPYDLDGTFVFDALNVYFNAPVDVEIASAIPVGSAGSIRFFIDHQRSSLSSANRLDWPILLEEKPVAADGSVQGIAPANVPLFEQLRTPQPDYTVPLSVGDFNPPYDPAPAAHVAGHNWGRPGARARCVGCHVGHTMIEVPVTDEAARWTNLAPGSKVRSSSLHAELSSERGVVDRRVRTGSGIGRFWFSGANTGVGEWIELEFPVPVVVRTVRLYNPPASAEVSVEVEEATVILYSDLAAENEVARQTLSSLSRDGSDVSFADVTARTVRVQVDAVTGALAGQSAAGLAEIEVIASGGNP